MNAGALSVDAYISWGLIRMPLKNCSITFASPGYFQLLPMSFSIRIDILSVALLADAIYRIAHDQSLSSLWR
jgi:hypothetical protein